jgi:hypothetical protein
MQNVCPRGDLGDELPAIEGMWTTEDGVLFRFILDMGDMMSQELVVPTLLLFARDDVRRMCFSRILVTDCSRSTSCTSVLTTPS